MINRRKLLSWTPLAFFGLARETEAKPVVNPVFASYEIRNGTFWDEIPVGENNPVRKMIVVKFRNGCEYRSYYHEGMPTTRRAFPANDPRISTCLGSNLPPFTHETLTEVDAEWMMAEYLCTIHLHSMSSWIKETT